MRGPPASSFVAGAACKVGVLNKKCRGFFKWGMRYVVVDFTTGSLLYYHTNEDKEPRKIIDLSEANVDLLDFAENSAHGFRLSTNGPEARDFEFVGTDLWVVEKWVEAIRSAAASTSQIAVTQQQQTATTSQTSAFRGITSMDRTYVPPQALQQLPQHPIRSLSVSDGKQIIPSPSLASVPQPTNQSTGSTINGNTTTQPTIMANGGSGSKRSPSQTTVAVITMTPENKRLSPVEKDVVGIIKIGRTIAGVQPEDNCVTFRSKVVSRHHAEIWAINGDVYIRDVGSQTGTFLNAMRLSETGKDSKPYRLRSGDTVQFGVDFNKTEDDTSRCVALKVEIKTRIAEVDETANGAAGSTSDRTTNATVSGTTQNATLIGTQNQQATLVAQQSTANPTLVAQPPVSQSTMVAGQGNKMQATPPPPPPIPAVPAILTGQNNPGLAAAIATAAANKAGQMPGALNYAIASNTQQPVLIRSIGVPQMSSMQQMGQYSTNGPQPVIVMPRQMVISMNSPQMPK